MSAFHGHKLLTTTFMMVILGLAGTVRAQSLPTGVDTASLQLAGPRSQGGLWTPSAHLLEHHSWDLSLTYQFEHAVLRTTLPTGEVRGKNRRETIPWLNNRQTLYAQFAISPAKRIALIVGAPVLISQSSTAGVAIEGAPTGSAALGDIRLLARIALLQSPKSPIDWTLEFGGIMPSGNERLLFGERFVRYQVGMALGVPFGNDFRVDARLAQSNGKMAVIGNLILGDTLTAQASVSQQIGNLKWFAELSNVNVISAKPHGLSPRRSALEIGAGVRYFFEDFYLAGGIGVGAVDAGYTPRVRAMFSIGTTGQYGRKPAATATAPRATYTELGDESLNKLARLIRDQPAKPTRCVLPPEGYEGALDDDGCIDFNNPHAAKEFQKHSLEDAQVYFEFGQSELTPSGKNTLRHIAIILMHNDGDVTIVGHADDRGTDALNQRLSEERAIAVKGALVHAGIDAGRLHVEARGSSAPISPDTDFGRSINRRVSFHWK